MNTLEDKYIPETATNSTATVKSKTFMKRKVFWILGLCIILLVGSVFFFTSLTSLTDKQLHQKQQQQQEKEKELEKEPENLIKTELQMLKERFDSLVWDHESCKIIFEAYINYYNNENVRSYFEGKFWQIKGKAKFLKANQNIHDEVINGDLNHVRFLIEVVKVSPNLLDSDNNTPLHIAAQSNNDEIVNYLLEHGSDKSLTNSSKNTALEIALALSGNEQVVQCLLK